MTRFEALGILPDKPVLTVLRWLKDEARYARAGEFPMEEVVEKCPLDGTYRLQTGLYRKRRHFVIKVSRIMPSGSIGQLWLKADSRKVLRNKKRFGWKFKSDKGAI